MPEQISKQIPFIDVPMGHVFEGWGDYFGISQGPMWIRAVKDRSYGGNELNKDNTQSGAGFCVGDYETVIYNGEVYGTDSGSEQAV